MPDELAMPSFGGDPTYLLFVHPSVMPTTVPPFVFLAKRAGFGKNVDNNGVAVRLRFQEELDWNARRTRLHAEREREAARLAADEVRWDRLEAHVKLLAAEVAALRQENEQLRREHAAERAARGDAEDTIRDHEELIEDLLVYLIVRQDWEDSGSTPPPPVLSWRIIAALRKRRAAMTGPIPTAHDQTTPPPTSQED